MDIIDNAFYWCEFSWKMHFSPWLSLDWFQVAPSWYTHLFSTAFQAHYHDLIDIAQEADCLGNTNIDAYATHILHAKWKIVDIAHVAFGQQNLKYYNCCNAHALLAKHTKLCHGSFGVYSHQTVHIDLKPGAQPVHQCEFLAPHANWLTVKKELDHMVQLGLLELCKTSKWVSSDFAIPSLFHYLITWVNLVSLNTNPYYGCLLLL